jgi:hypothetical protein
MQYTKTLLLFCSIITLFFAACSNSKKMSYQMTKNYKPDDPALYQTIVRLDSLFFDAYNNCATKLDYYSTFYADDIEFYHDNGGLATSKPQIIESTKNNICGKVTRHLVKGSIEVYPIKNYGAVEIGLHYFYNNQEADGGGSKIGRFMIIWTNKNNDWKIARVISLH